MATSAECIVAVFAKAPRPGQVKTRLIPLLGAEGASALHRRLLEHSLRTARAASLSVIELWCAPDMEDAILGQCAALEGVSLLDQGPGSLGDRMGRAFQAMLARAPLCMLIGSDCPSLTGRDLIDAASVLAEPDCDAVFTPAEDGGYVLIGLKAPHPTLFEGIPWSTGEVMQTTRVRLKELGLRWHELPTRWDVDRPEDYQRLLLEMPSFRTGPVDNVMTSQP